MTKSFEKVASLRKSRCEQAVPKFLSMCRRNGISIFGKKRDRSSTEHNFLTDTRADLAPQNTRKVLMTSLSSSWVRGDSLFILIVLEGILDEKTSRILKND